MVLTPQTSQKHQSDFKILSQIARDILAIPVVSVAVERLFSSSRSTLTDARSSMSAESASKMITTKKWLKHGFGSDIEYLEGISTHDK